MEAAILPKDENSTITEEKALPPFVFKLSIENCLILIRPAEGIWRVYGCKSPLT